MTKRISGKQLMDLAIIYTVRVKPSVESPIIFEFAQFIKDHLSGASLPVKSTDKEV